MADDKEADRSRRKKRRGQQEREKTGRRAEQEKAVRREAKSSDAKTVLDLRIGKLIEQGYSPNSVAKRLGVTARRINLSLDAIQRQ